MVPDNKIRNLPAASRLTDHFGMTNHFGIRKKTPESRLHAPVISFSRVHSDRARALQKIKSFTQFF